MIMRKYALHRLFYHHDHVKSRFLLYVFVVAMRICECKLSLESELISVTKDDCDETFLLLCSSSLNRDSFIYFSEV